MVWKAKVFMTRQWLADPKKMCSKHIVGEHAEAHGFLNKMRNGNSLDGFIEGSMFFGAEYVKSRHDMLAEYISHHTTELELTPMMIREYPLIMPDMSDLKVSLGTLLGRCEDCRQKYQR